MSDTPSPALLSAERLDEIRRTSGDTRCRNPYVTEYGVAADVVEELLDHLSAREAQLREVLAGLLVPEPTEAEYYADGQQGVAAGANKRRNADIHAAANLLGISLSAPPAAPVGEAA